MLQTIPLMWWSGMKFRAQSSGRSASDTATSSPPRESCRGVFPTSFGRPVVPVQVAFYAACTPRLRFMVPYGRSKLWPRRQCDPAHRS